MEIPDSIKRRLGAEVRLFRMLAGLRMNADQVQLRGAVEDMVQIRNSKLWFLLSAVVIASVGLNTGSAAVIIGAMLISPLMGPIVGLGYALAVRDRVLTWQALRYVAVSSGMSIGVSTIYFGLSPLTEPTSELLGRVRPTLLDLVVAVAAGAAGVIAMGVRDAGGTIPGVAIATAIVPPLCTAGWGIASLQPVWAAGGFYLFFTNAVAISGAAYFLFRRMHVKETTEASGGRLSVPVMVAFALFLVPLCWSFLVQIRDHRRTQAARQFIAEVEQRHRVVSWTFLRSSPPQFVLLLLDEPGVEDRRKLEAALFKHLRGTKLVLKTSELSTEVKSTLSKIESRSVDTATAIVRIQKAIDEQRAQAEERARRERIEQEAARNALAIRIAAEWRALDPRVQSVFTTPPAADGTIAVVPELDPP